MTLNNTETTLGLRGATYGRFSTKMQRRLSLADQYRVCEESAACKGVQMLQEFVRGDEAVQGRKFTSRAALMSLLQDANTTPRPFDYLFVDAADRLGRFQEKNLRIVRKFREAGVRVFFVREGIDSGDFHFPVAHSIAAAQAEADSKQFAHRVRRGHEGARLRGMSTGGLRYGYRTQARLRDGIVEARSHADRDGYDYVIHQAEAEIVLRIFRSYNDGIGVYRITKWLTAEGIPNAHQRLRTSSGAPSWSPTGVLSILRNEMYRGKLVWNRHTTWFDHDEEKVRVISLPEDQWKSKEFPHLRIVPEALWLSVHELLAKKSDTAKAQQAGGLARAKKGAYPFSGLLKCGLCGGNFNIVSGGKGKISAYGCINARYGRGGCKNNMWIREDYVTGQLFQALSENLLNPEVLSGFVVNVATKLGTLLKSRADNSSNRLSAKQAHERSLGQDVDRLISLLLRAEGRESDALLRTLRKKELDLEQVRREIERLRVPTTVAVTQLDLQKLVTENVRYLREILTGNVERTREVLRHHIRELRLFPEKTPKGKCYYVVGDIDLFTPFQSDEKSGLLTPLSTRRLQQYTTDFDIFSFIFCGSSLRAMRAPATPINKAPICEGESDSDSAAKAPHR